MFKRISKAFWLSICVVLVATAGCKKNTFNINDNNPNNPTPDAVSPNLLLAGNLKKTADIVRGGQTLNNTVYGDPDYLQLYMGYWAASGDYLPNTQELTYQTTTDYYQDNWNSGYLLVENLRLMETSAATDPNAGYYVAIGKIMEAFYFQRLVHQDNEVPYSQGVGGGATAFPEIDNDSEC